MSDLEDVEQAVKCAHPGWPLLIGWDAVRSAWEAIFESADEMRFTISEALVEVAGDLA